ncbi:CLUMA_CG018083, isoform A [Clunio marinus]|uniref:CLUMA_CG018083, isoform A n=1 Tax=Clunio marinus TaxID=568069 RepID=A0A1J1J0N7_9DIPT|nr:CLUMA_CG018083, isoform A [Clunio marinus]
MNTLKISIGFALVALASAGAQSYVKRSESNDGYVISAGEGDHHDEHNDYYHHPSYKFEYGVHDPHTGDHKSHWEHREGDHVTGEYSLDEADGTKRVVEYHADGKTGFHANVKRIGHAHHTGYEHGGFE